MKTSVTISVFEKLCATVVGFLCVVLILGALIALPIKWLWNWLCPVLFNLPEINVWQALGLFVLIHCLFPGTTKK